MVADPSADLFGNEPVYLSGEWVGYVRAAAYGYTVGGPVALAQVACEDGVTSEWLKSGDFTVRTDEREWPAASRSPRSTTPNACAFSTRPERCTARGSALKARRLKAST